MSAPYKYSPYPLADGNHGPHSLEIAPLEPDVLASNAIDVYVGCRESGVPVEYARKFSEGTNNTRLMEIAEDICWWASEESPEDRYAAALIPWGNEVCTETLDTFIQLYERQSYKAKPAKCRTLAKITETHSALTPDGERTA